MTDGIDPRWKWWTLACAIPALVLGVVLYPDVQLESMPPGPAVLAAIAGAGAILLAGRPRLIVLVPLASAYLPSLQIGFVSYAIALGVIIPIALARRIARPLDIVDWSLLAVALLAVVSWLANLGPETDLWSLPMFALTFLTPWLLFFFARALEWTRPDIKVLIGVWLALAMSQVLVALAKPLLLGMPGMYAVPLLLAEAAQLSVRALLPVTQSADLTFGSTTSAHHLGIAMLLATCFLVAFSLAARRPRWSWYAVVTLFVFLMTDSKHVVLAALIPAGWFLAEVVWPRLDFAWRLRLAGAGIALAIGIVAVIGARLSELAVSGLWRPYVELAAINPKVRLVLRTTDRMTEGGLHSWIGYGPGSFASRAATIRASEVLYKSEAGADFVPSHTGDSYRQVAYDLYTAEIARTAGFRSGALTNPFSSLVGIAAEFGLIGSAVVLVLLLASARTGFSAWRCGDCPPAWRAAGAAAGFGVPLLLFLGIFDSYFEQPDVTAVLVALLLVATVAPEVAGRDSD